MSAWKGKKLLITSGPTREFIDPIRFLTNASSGKMGWALAGAAQRAGASVVVVSGPVAASPPPGVRVLWVENALQMRRKALEWSKKCDAVIAAAAVTDWRAARPRAQKIRRRSLALRLRLSPNPDIIGEISRLKGAPGRFKPRALVGFALETEKILSSALRKMKEKNLDMIVANSVASLGADLCRATLILRGGRRIRTPLISKEKLARLILEKTEAFL